MCRSPLREMVLLPDYTPVNPESQKRYVHCRCTIWRPRLLHSTSLTVFVGQWMIEGSLPPCSTDDTQHSKSLKSLVTGVTHTHVCKYNVPIDLSIQPSIVLSRSTCTFEYNYFVAALKLHYCFIQFPFL